MSWRDLLSQDATIVVPWTGGRSIRSGGRTWKISGHLPPEHGWYAFCAKGGRDASWKQGDAVIDIPEMRGRAVVGYLVGDWLVPDDARVVLSLDQLQTQTIPVWLIEPGLERFSRIRAVLWEEEKYVFERMEFPKGPEGGVLEAYLNRKESIVDIKDVTPALDLAFRFETQRRLDLEEMRRRVEEERRQEEERQRKEALRAEAIRLVGTSAGRREIAEVDFDTAARAALAMTGAELLDARPSYNRGEMVVQYRFRERRLECVVDRKTLRIVDSGVCLTAHDTGEKGDTRFTLESLPSVIGEALDRGVLHVYRHVDRYDDDTDEEDY